MKKFFKKYKFKLIFILFAVIIITLVFTLFSVDSNTNASNIQYISSFGWEVNDTPADITRISLPEEFNSLYIAYSDIASVDGKNLEEYSGKNIAKYSYIVNNHKDSDDDAVRANVYVHKSQIIAADISSLKTGGFTIPLSDTSDMK